MSQKILLSTDDPGVGGVAQYNHSILCGLVRCGFTVTSIHPSPYHQAYSQLVVDQQEMGVKHLWMESSASSKDLDHLKFILRKELEETDLLICSNSNPFSNLLVKQIATEINVPYMIVEGLVEPHLASNFPEYLEQLFQYYTKARSVIAVSQNNLSLLHKFFKLPKNKGKVIHYGRPLNYFTPRDLSVNKHLRQDFDIPLDAVVCLTSARIEKRKGYHYQLEAIQQFMSTSVWDKLYFVWVGGGIFDPQFEVQLQEKVKQLKINDKVKFLGQREDVSKLLNMADIFILPSELEGMPLSVMEAMSKGLPVIATAVSGIPEELGNTGKLITDPKHDPKATVRELVETIRSWATDLNLRETIGKACQQRAEKMFREEKMINETIQVVERALLPEKDYVSTGLIVVQPDQYFPNMIVGDPDSCLWPYLRRSIPHNWYVDLRQPTVGFLSRDEAHIVYNTALKFQNKQALEIGCWMGWSACHLALAGVSLDVIDPLLERPDFYESVTTSLRNAGVLDQVNLVAGYSPKQVEELANQFKRKWSLIFIDGDHEAPGPLKDAMTCEKYAEDDAIILFHDLASPDVAQGLDYLRDQGWNTMVYQTMQIMGVAWRGNVEPVMHQPDVRVNWQLPVHLQGYTISNLSQDFSANEFREILTAVRPYTLLSEERLFSLYSLAKQVCLEDIPGNFVECGAYKGGASALLAAIIKRYTLRPRFLYAFDTFEGMPDPTDADLHNGIPANQTGFGAGTLDAPIRENLDRVCKLLDVRNIVKPVQGLFSETLPQYKQEIGDIAFLHADGDWYESTMDIFNNFYDNVVFGGNIQIDDYGHWEGCKKAIHEFEELKGEAFTLHTIDYTGVWFRKGGDLKNEKSETQALEPTICIDSVFFQLYKTGIARVWRSILEEWAKSDFAKYIVILDRGGTAPKIPGIRYRSIPLYSYAATDADHEMLQQVCDEEGADLFISTYYTTPISTPSVFMAYDMIPEVLGADFNEPMWREKHHAIGHASAYVSISENTASDLVKYFSGISSEQVTVAHCGVSKTFSPATPAQIQQFKMKYGITKPYFILVGAGSNYKNAGLFFKAFDQLYSKQGFEIVCTGGSSLWLSAEYRQFTSGCVVHPLQLSDQELSIAYSGATALVYPSLYEGFGMPVAEAMACGCPVITCPNSSLPEVGGEAVIYINENDIEALVEALCDVQKPKVRNSLIAAGLEQVKRFSWNKMADTVSSALINTTLLRLNLGEINLIIFPDWSQQEESLNVELGQVIKAVLTHPKSSQITLLIDNSNISGEEADLVLSSIIMNLMMEEELEVSDEPNLALIGELSEIQWSALIPRLKGRIALQHEDKTALKQTQVKNIPPVQLDSLK